MIKRRVWEFLDIPQRHARWIAAPTYEDALIQARLRGWDATRTNEPLYSEGETARMLADDRRELIDVVFPYQLWYAYQTNLRKDRT